MSQALSVLQSLTFGQPLILWLFVLAVPLVLLTARVRLRTTRIGLRFGVLLHFYLEEAGFGNIEIERLSPLSDYAILARKL